jgi:hypothetical protein
VRRLSVRADRRGEELSNRGLTFQLLRGRQRCDVSIENLKL